MNERHGNDIPKKTIEITTCLFWWMMALVVIIIAVEDLIK